MNFNKAIIVGRLTRDPESRALPSGQTVSSFGLATNRVWTNREGNKQEATEFHNIVAFGKLADICSRYLNKGQLILIEGRIQTNSWEDKDGNKRYRTEIIADNMQMGPRAGSSTERSAGTPNQSETEKSATPETKINQEEIPIIEAEEPIENQENKNMEDTSPEKKEEVDVKNIPF